MNIDTLIYNLTPRQEPVDEIRYCTNEFDRWLNIVPDELYDNIKNMQKEDVLRWFKDSSERLMEYHIRDDKINFSNVPLAAFTLSRERESFIHIEKIDMGHQCFIISKTRYETDYKHTFYRVL